MLYIQTATRGNKNNVQPKALRDRLDILPVEAVESARILVQDPNSADLQAEAKTYWCPLNEDTVPFHEHFTDPTTEAATQVSRFEHFQKSVTDPEIKAALVHREASDNDSEDSDPDSDQE